MQDCPTPNMCCWMLQPAAKADLLSAVLTTWAGAACRCFPCPVRWLAASPHSRWAALMHYAFEQLWVASGLSSGGGQCRSQHNSLCTPMRFSAVHTR